MLESIEGKRGIVRFKPPIPALEGLFGKPTVINNVLSFAACRGSSPMGPSPMPTMGSAARVARCRSSSPEISGTAAWSRRPSASRFTISSTTFGGGTASGRPVRAVQVGGPLGAYLPVSHFRSCPGLRNLRRQ